MNQRSPAFPAQTRRRRGTEASEITSVAFQLRPGLAIGSLLRRSESARRTTGGRLPTVGATRYVTGLKSGGRASVRSGSRGIAALPQDHATKRATNSSAIDLAEF